METKTSTSAAFCLMAEIDSFVGTLFSKFLRTPPNCVKRSSFSRFFSFDSVNLKNNDFAVFYFTVQKVFVDLKSNYSLFPRCCHNFS